MSGREEEPAARAEEKASKGVSEDSDPFLTLTCLRRRYKKTSGDTSRRHRLLLLRRSLLRWDLKREEILVILDLRGLDLDLVLSLMRLAKTARPTCCP